MFITPTATKTAMRCTAPGCRNDVPFRVYKKSIASSGGLNIDCDVERVLGVLGAVLPANAQVTRTAADLVIHSLCSDCWALKDAAWGGADGAGSYLEAAAKAAADGVFFNTTRPDFRQANGIDLNMTKIKCTVVHEMVHWTVVPTTQGFQNMNQTRGMRGSDWDECMTDYLALTTYKGLNWGTYVTGYNRLPAFMDIGINLLKLTSPAAFKRAAGPSLVACFPDLGINIDAVDLKAEVEKIRVPLFNKLAYRYVQGNALQLGEAIPTLEDFVTQIFPSSISSKLSVGQFGLYGPATY